MMRSAPALLLVSLCSCVYSDMKQETLDAFYPPGAHRDEILMKDEHPPQRHDIDGRPRDGFAARAFRDIMAETGTRPAFYDFNLRIRGWFGLYGDYVFYDEDEILLRACRRFLD